MVKKIAGILVVLFLLVTIGIIFFVVKQQQELRKKAAPATTLSFSPAQKTAKVGEIVTLNVVMDTGGNQISTVQIKASFDPQYFEVETITNSAEFPATLAAADLSTPGLATLHVSVPSTIPFSGETIVATMRVKPLTPTTNPVSITLSGSYAQSSAEGSNNAIVLANPAVITISGAQPDGVVTPTVIPDAAPSSSPEPTESPASTVSPSPTYIDPSPTQQSQTAGNFEIYSPEGNGAISSNPPTFSGVAEANSSITIALSPGTVSGAVSTTPSGTWSFTPISPLSAGRYTATIVMTNPTTGLTKTSNVIFTIAATAAGVSPTSVVTPETTTEQMPVTGSVAYTGILLFFAVVLLGAGIIIPMYK